MQHLMTDGPQCVKAASVERQTWTHQAVSVQRQIFTHQSSFRSETDHYISK